MMKGLCQIASVEKTEGAEMIRCAGREKNVSIVDLTATSTQDEYPSLGRTVYLVALHTEQCISTYQKLRNDSAAINGPVGQARFPCK